ncbi:LysR family transcriptional regulator [Jiella endophytica]|uniref:LysR family transcriptional regulator n=2 Tax=Jiella endophytica TaxID=2558362 RepID=A0A4Y8RKC8_9HYPH|nr:LysR family transcriptional regulator [Jiella endophytica]
MTMQMRQVRAFLELSETLSFSEASSRVGLSQPAFSLSIQKLEEALGTRLFDRTSRTVSLTREGEAFLPLARRLAATWDETVEEMADLVAVRRGRVALAALPSLAARILPDAVARFAASHPDVSIRIADVLHGTVVDLVLAGRVDYGFSVEPESQDELSFTPLVSDRFVAVLRDDDSLAGRARLTWNDLLSEPLISMTGITSVRRRLDAALAGRKAPRLVGEVNQLATVSGLVLAGLGVSALPALCLPVVMRPGLTWRPLDEPVAERTLGLVHRRKQSFSLAARAFLSELRSLPDSPMLSGLGDEIRFEPFPGSA